MEKKYQRKLVNSTNPFQNRIIISVMVPALVACMMCLIMLAYVYYMAQHLAYYAKTDASWPDMFMPWFLDVSQFLRVVPGLLLIITGSMLGVAVWSFYFSNKLVGPYTRIIRELDDIISGKSKKPITLREGDDMFMELFKRINQLIEKIPSK